MSDSEHNPEGVAVKVQSGKITAYLISHLIQMLPGRAGFWHRPNRWLPRAPPSGGGAAAPINAKYK